MSEPLSSNRLPISMYCTLRTIVKFEREKDDADRVLNEESRGRNCVCILPVLEDGKHYYLQCNFKRKFSDSWMFKFVDTLDTLCEQNVLPRLDRDYQVETYLFLTGEGKAEFSRRPVHNRIRSKFEVINRVTMPEPVEPSVVGRLFWGMLGRRADETWSSTDSKLVEELRSVLARRPGCPIDTSFAPASLKKLKQVLMKRFALADELPDAPSKAEAESLFLELSWFVDRWDELSCEGIYKNLDRRRRPGESVENAAKRLMDQLIHCLGNEGGCALVEKNRERLANELKSFRIANVRSSGART